MPAERDSTYPTATASEANNAPGTREEKAARFIVARHIKGIPRRAFIMGDNDSAVIVQGVRDLTRVCYMVLDDFEATATDDQRVLLLSLKSLLEDHGCPETKDETQA